MTTIGAFMSGDHRRCDDIFVAAEKLTADRAWEQAVQSFTEFRDAMEHHFAMEEQVLFPSFESATGSTMGPTQVMRFEHRQMRDLFAAMEQAVRAGDRDSYLGEAETLLVLMQQHNAKEEQILYPMSERVLAEEQREILSRMERVGT